MAKARIRELTKDIPKEAVVIKKPIWEPFFYS